MSTKHFKNVTSEVLDRSKVPINVSTHLPIKWYFEIEEKSEEESEEKKEENLTSKKLPRPDWRNKIDFELFRRLEQIYIEVAMRLTRDLAAPWKAKTLEFMLSKHQRSQG